MHHPLQHRGSAKTSASRPSAARCTALRVRGLVVISACQRSLAAAATALVGQAAREGDADEPRAKAGGGLGVLHAKLGCIVTLRYRSYTL